MENTLTIHGVPQSLALDAWWLDAEPAEEGDGPATRAAWRPARRAGAILLLVLLADVLFWRQAPGLSAVLFAAAVLAISMQQTGAKSWRRPAALLGLAALPAVDHVQALSLLFLAAGLIAALVWSQRPDAPGAAVLEIAARFLGLLPRRWIGLVDPRKLSCLREVDTRAQSLRSLLRNWALPVGGSLVFIALLMSANPVLAQLLRVDLDLWAILRRSLFWAGTAVFIAPFLMPMDAPVSTGAAPRPARLRLPSMGINAGSVLRALVTFNLLIGVQSLTDLSILLGGAALPEGMTMAEYAHRGAYPLLATAILAGAFALAARPYLGEHRLIKPLLLVWLAQNMVLCGAAALRLDLYIGAFGLTYLRLYALIWMGLVAAGLGMVLWQVLRGLSNGWLMSRGAVLAVATLYCCSFVNFAQIVAAQNVTRADPDLHYLCALGPLAAGPIVQSGLGQVFGGGIVLDACNIANPRVEGWRQWGFRTWATHRYVQQAARAERP